MCSYLVQRRSARSHNRAVDVGCVSTMGAWPVFGEPIRLEFLTDRISIYNRNSRILGFEARSSVISEGEQNSAKTRDLWLIGHWAADFLMGRTKKETIAAKKKTKGDPPTCRIIHPKTPPEQESSSIVCRKILARWDPWAPTPFLYGEDMRTVQGWLLFILG